MKRKLPFILAAAFVVVAAVTITIVLNWPSAPPPEEDTEWINDPLVDMPGSQPGQVSLEAPNRCMNCHGGYNAAVEPGFNWQGSMMAQAGRDFLYWTCLTVGAQDAMWAVGSPNATDICLRCHMPKGWLEDRSTPTNGSSMIGADFDGVQCDFCHSTFDPFFEATYSGAREGGDWLGYWDETNASGTASQPAADGTYQEDVVQAQAIHLFNGNSFYVDNNPFSLNYTENGSGQYFVSAGGEKRAPFADAAARHQMLYSRYHKSKYFCSTCHDVSNPVLANLAFDGTPPDDGTTILPTEENAAYSYYHVERTFSEFMLSAYGQPGGAAGIGPFAPGVFETSYTDNSIAKCQDCHMRDVTGAGCNKKGVPVRPGDSSEHPNSGQPLHDQTGGNIWVSYVLASAVPGSPNHDSVNEQLLNQGPAVLTLDLTQGEGIDPGALLAGADRARQQLQLAASIQDLAYDPNSGSLSFRIQNQTGHKLLSGFPEGRRMFVNIRAYAGGVLIHEVNPYDAAAGSLKGLNYTYSTDTLPPPTSLGAGEVYVDELVYQMHPSSSLTGEEETFHFVLGTGRYKDNRIPPQGFRIDEAAARLSEPVWHGVVAPDYFTADEYAGGYDQVNMADYGISIPGADYLEVNLYYQVTSREYVEFLRNEINGTGPLTLPSEAYVIQTDPFFSGLKAWGDTTWQLWTHNADVPGAAPFMMAQATYGAGAVCEAPAPALLSAQAGHTQVALTWTDEHSADPNVVSYGVYYDQAGKAQLVAAVPLVTTYTDGDLTNGQEYCYKVTARYEGCESDFSNILCATPSNQAQTPIGVTVLETGQYTGKGKNRVFTADGTFAVGDEVVIRVYVVDGNSGAPVSNATVEISIGGPEAVLLTTGPSGGDGMAEATWQTQQPNKRGQGGTPPGTYTATVEAVTANGYVWDGVATSISFVVQ